MVGDLEKLVWRKHWRFGETWSAIWRNLFGKIRWRFGESWSVIWRNLFGEIRWRFGETVVGDLEKKLFSEIRWRFGETVVGDLEKNCSTKFVGDLEKRGRRCYGDFVLEFVME